MKDGLNVAGLVAGVILVVVSLPSTMPGLMGMGAGLALAGLNIYFLLARRKANRHTGQGNDA